MASFCGALLASFQGGNTRNFCSIIPFLSSVKYYHFLNASGSLDVAIENFSEG